MYLYSKVCPTPYIPFGVQKYKCAAGIMITASHNPKDDNGYKVYWENGAQIISPHDKGISKYILQSLEPAEEAWITGGIYSSRLYKDPLDEVMSSYNKLIRDDTIYPEVNGNTSLILTYTAMHGVGYEYMCQAFKAANFKVIFFFYLTIIALFIKYHQFKINIFYFLGICSSGRTKITRS